MSIFFPTFFAKGALGRLSALDKLFLPSCELHVPSVVLILANQHIIRDSSHVTIRGRGGGGVRGKGLQLPQDYFLNTNA